MRVPFAKLAAFAVLTTVVGGGAARGQAAVPDQACSARERAAAAREASDGAVVKDAVAVSNKGHFAALQAKLPALQAVLDNAPARLPAKTCDGASIVWVNSPTEALAMLVKAAATPGAGRTIALGPTPYATAALLLGSSKVEAEQYTQALVPLKRGLALAPTDPRLVTEAANTLTHLGRFEEALPLIDRGLAANPAAAAEERARLLRSRGFALGELKRYDEAEAAYRESLKLQPGHVGARNELIYIARMKAGGKATREVLMTGDKAATTSADDVLAARPK